VYRVRACIDSDLKQDSVALIMFPVCNLLKETWKPIQTPHLLHR
jgi:hypothetical protein